MRTTVKPLLGCFALAVAAALVAAPSSAWAQVRVPNRTTGVGTPGAPTLRDPSMVDRRVPMSPAPSTKVTARTPSFSRGGSTLSPGGSGGATRPHQSAIERAILDAGLTAARTGVGRRGPRGSCFTDSSQTKPPAAGAETSNSEKKSTGRDHKKTVKRRD